MHYYNIVFNRPMNFGKEEVSTLTYAYHEKISPGVRVYAELGSSRIMGLIVGSEDDEENIIRMQRKGVRIKSIDKVLDKEPLLNLDQIELAHWMSQYYLSTWGECIFTMLPSAKQERNAVFSHKVISHYSREDIKLSEAQLHCIDEIAECVYNPHINLYYIYGVTGSGKTEIFLQSISNLIDTGSQVIYLVPEITLVTQAYPFLCELFGKEKIAVLHSGLTASARLKEWNRIRNNQAHIILGVRSAVFAPCVNLGMIVLDEEHDQSYKSASSPRYHARQIAMKRMQQHNGLLLMASATPSAEAWAFKNQPSMKFVELKKRVAGGQLPKIEIESLQHSSSCISVRLYDEIVNTLKIKKQVLLLVNRRGFSQTFLCGECGEIVKCPHCSVNLNYHRVSQVQEFLFCHHCGYKMNLPDQCTKCGFVQMTIKGWGIQRVEEELKSLFPKVEIARLDSDLAKDKEKSLEVLEAFYNNSIQIMVGTQILAKGINIPNLNLVGIIFADALMSLPDFRAEERAFALMIQVAGRAGRFSEQGKVIIQSFGSDKEFFSLLKNSDYSSFIEGELARRKQYGLSPYKRVLRLVFRSKHKVKAQELSELCSEHILGIIRREKLSDISVYGPSACVLEKISDNYRFQILLTADSIQKLSLLCKKVLLEGLKSKSSAQKVYIEIDPDPLSFM